MVFREMLVGYVRVSSADERQNTDLQQDAMRQAGIDERNIYGDRVSGSIDHRPGLEECLSFIRPGDVLVVWKLDRLGRSLRHLITIVEALREKGVGLRSLTEPIDTTTSMGELVFHFFGAIAQYERSLIQERVNAGLAAARHRGRFGGRPRRIDSEKLEVAIGLLGAGKTLSAVARAVGVPRSTLVDSLRRSPPTVAE